MKRIFIFIISAVLIFSLSVNVHAGDAIYRDANELFQYWESKKCYPDYVCGVWSNYGTLQSLTISVQNTAEGNKGKSEILDLIENDESVTFVYGEHSRNYLLKVQEELSEYMGYDTGLIMVALMEKENGLALGIHKDKKGSPEEISLTEDLRAKYGDIFTVEYTDIIVTYGSLSGDPVTDDTPDYLIFIGITVILLAFLSVFIIIIRKRNAAALLTSTGDTETASSLTVKAVKRAIKNSAPSPTPLLDKRVMTSIEKTDTSN